jgi:hypothetical protein
VTRDEIREWRRWLDRVERRCSVDDVPVLVRRLSLALTELDARAAAEPRQLTLDSHYPFTTNGDFRGGSA